MIADIDIFTIKDYLELIYFLCGGPILAIVAAFALFQIKVSKEQIRIVSKRESIKLAAEQSTLYIKNIVPLFNKLSDYLIKEKKIDIEKNTITIHNNRVTGNFDDKIINELILNDEKSLEIICDIINALEGFSIYFTSKIADSEIGYTSVGKTFLFCVERYYSLIFLVSDSEDIQNNKNTHTLFIDWYNLSQKYSLEKELNNINKQKEFLSNKIKIFSDKKIEKSIGV